MRNADSSPGSGSRIPLRDNLDLPCYGATFGRAIKRYVLKFGVFEGRASRSEYWWVALLNAVVYILCFAMMAVGGLNLFDRSSIGVPDASFPWLLIMLAYYLLTFFPNWSLATRRLHDINANESQLSSGFPGYSLLGMMSLARRPSDPAGARYDSDWVKEASKSEEH